MEHLYSCHVERPLTFLPYHGWRLVMGDKGWRTPVLHGWGCVPSSSLHQRGAESHALHERLLNQWPQPPSAPSPVEPWSGTRVRVEFLWGDHPPLMGSSLWPTGPVPVGPPSY